MSNVNLKVSCNDAADIISKIVNTDPDQPIFGKNGTACKDGATTEDGLDGLKHVGSTLAGYKCKDDDNCKKVINDLIDEFVNFLGNDKCGKTFCGNTDERVETISLGSCDNVKEAIKHLLSQIKTTLDKKQPNSDYDQYLSLDALCNTLDLLTPQQASDLVAAKLPDILATKLKLQPDDPLINSTKDLLNKLNIQQVVQCTCPNMGKVQDKTPSISKPSYNKKLVGFLALVVLIVTLIPVILISIFVRTKKTKIISLVSTVTAGIVLFLVLFFSNPLCVLKPCPTVTDQWVPLNGTYEGSSDKIAGVQVDVKIKGSNKDAEGKDAWKKQNIEFVTLKCDGGACPFNNLLEECNSKNLTASLGQPETHGYPLLGDCVNKMYQMTSPVEHIKPLRGVWLVRSGNKVFLQILVNIVVDPLNIEKYILVELTKTS
jgi:hypothetical protein